MRRMFLKIEVIKTVQSAMSGGDPSKCQLGYFGFVPIISISDFDTKTGSPHKRQQAATFPSQKRP